MISKPIIIGTGLSGMVGSRLVELYGNIFTFENLDLSNGIDITSEEKVKQAIGQSRGKVVIHLAAFTNVNAAFSQTNDKNGSCYRVNVLGTRNVAQSCSSWGKYLVHISTDFVFNGNKKTPYTESDPPKPIEWYGQTKYLAEEEVKKSGAKHLIIRFAYPYRAEFAEKKDLVRQIIDKLTRKETLHLFIDHIITPTFIDDIAQAIKIIIQKQPTGILNVTGSTSVSDYKLGQTIAKVFSLEKSLIKKSSLEEYLKTSKRPYQKRLAMSNAKLKNTLGISMSTLEQGLNKMKQQLANG